MVPTLLESPRQKVDFNFCNSTRIHTFMLQRFRDFLLAEDDDWHWLPNQRFVPIKPPEKPASPFHKPVAAGTWPRSRIVRPQFSKFRIVKTAAQAIGPIKYPKWSNPVF